jgi:hypothetical protein
MATKKLTKQQLKSLILEQMSGGSKQKQAESEIEDFIKQKVEELAADGVETIKGFGGPEFFNRIMKDIVSTRGRLVAQARTPEQRSQSGLRGAETRKTRLAQWQADEPRINRQIEQENQAAIAEFENLLSGINLTPKGQRMAREIFQAREAGSGAPQGPVVGLHRVKEWLRDLKSKSKTKQKIGL